VCWPMKDSRYSLCNAEAAPIVQRPEYSEKFMMQSFLSRISVNL